MNNEGKIYAEYKGQKYRLITIKALLRGEGSSKDVWANVNEVQILASENGNGDNTDVDDGDIQTILSALDREAAVFRKVLEKPNVLGSDRKHARQQLSRIVSLKDKLATLS